MKLKPSPSAARFVFCLFCNASLEDVAGVLKGTATARLSNGDVRLAEIHWFEAHGIGGKFLRIKQYLD